jgi:hypothetical protein
VAASWTSGTPGVATVNSTSGVATGVASGSSVITATFGGQTATATLTVTAPSATLVSIAVTPATALIPATGTKQFTVTGTYSDGTTPDVTALATWTSVNVPATGTAVATLSTDGAGGGLATGNRIGQSTITATFGAVPSASATLNVTVNLRRATTFAVVAGGGLTNANATTITGDVGVLSATAIPSTINGTYSVGTGSAPFDNALADLTPAFNEASDTVAVPCTADYGDAAKDYTGMSLPPGVYCNGTGAINISAAALSLNAPGVYIFRTTGPLTPAQPVQFTGAGMTSANTSVFWVVGSASTTTTAWKGTILSTVGAITLQAGSTLIDGRALSTAAVTLATNTITKPTP